MSGKGSGKKRNRAAQSEQHGFQQPPDEKAAGSEAEGTRGKGKKGSSDHQRVLDKLKDLERRRKDREGDQPER